MKRFIYLLTLALLTFFVYGCEKNTYFQTESGVKKKIERRWHLVRVSEAQPIEDWSFAEGRVYRISVSNPSKPDTVDVGNYQINTTLSDAYLIVSDFKQVSYHYNTKYTIEQINEDYLTIFGNDQTNGAGTIYREFTAN